MGKLSTSPRYGIDITKMDLISLGEFGGGGLIQKNEVFFT